MASARTPLPADQFKVEFHCHTVFSMDGLIRFDSLLRAADRVGLDAVAVTDHDTIEGALEFQRWAHKRGARLQVIVGEEKTLSDGSHFIGFFLREPLTSGSLAGAVAEIHSQGGLCLAPHPFRSKDGVLRESLDSLPLLEEAGAGFELFNSKCSWETNRRARELLATRLNPFGGSDAHYESDLGECVNVMPWQGDLRRTIELMLRRRSPLRILGTRQTESTGERAYAPWYYRVRKYVRMPKPLLPAAKQCYRWYRNSTRGVGLKPLVEIHARG